MPTPVEQRRSLLPPSRRRERKAGEETEGTTWPARRGSWSREEPGGRIRLGREWGRWVGRRLFRLRTHRTAGDRVHAEGVAKPARREKDQSRNQREVVPYEGTKGITMKGLSGQLARKALAVEDVRAKAKKKKKKKNTSSKALSLLRDLILNKTGTEKKHAKEKDRSGRKKKKRRKLVDGVIVSSSSSSGGDSDSKERRSMWTARRGYGGAHAAKVTRQSWERAVDADGARAVPDGPGFSDRGEQEPKAHRRSEGNFLLQPPHPSKLWEPSERTARDVHPGHDDRSPEKGGARASGRQSLSPVHGLAPVADRPIVGDGKAHGIIPSGGVDGRVLCLGSGVEETSAVGRQGAGKSGWTSWQPKGKGNPRQDWSQWSESNPKGKKGKGNPNKGKGKGKGSWNQAPDKGVTDWEKNKEKAEGAK